MPAPTRQPGESEREFQARHEAYARGQGYVPKKKPKKPKPPPPRRGIESVTRTVFPGLTEALSRTPRKGTRK